MIPVGAMECHEEHSEHIKSRNTGTHQRQAKYEFVVGKGRNQNFVFGEKARQEWESCNGQGSDQESKISNGHFLTQTTHLTDVLLVVHAMNHTSRTQEQQRFKESVRNHMKQCSGIGATTEGDKHQTQLTHSTVGQYFFDIVLF